MVGATSARTRSRRPGWCLAPGRSDLGWSSAQVRRFLEATHDDRLHALWRVALLRGLRRGELFALRWSTSISTPRRCTFGPENRVLLARRIAGHGNGQGAARAPASPEGGTARDVRRVRRPGSRVRPRGRHGDSAAPGDRWLSATGASPRVAGHAVPRRPAHGGVDRAGERHRHQGGERPAWALDDATHDLINTSFAGCTTRPPILSRRRSMGHDRPVRRRVAANWSRNGRHSVASNLRK
jgi:hypothetical protein